MPTPEPARVRDLAARFTESNRADQQALRDGAAQRREIVTEMLTFMTPAEVAAALRISTARVTQIVGSVREVRRHLAGHRTPTETMETYGR
jgi:hypothetical protein